MMNFIKRLEARNKNPRSERPILIACIGDSVTHGCFELIADENEGYKAVCRPDEGYVAKLSARLRQMYPFAAVNVLNAGIDGDTSRGGWLRLERDVLSFNPDLVTVNFALNDSMNRNVEASLAAYEKNIRQIFCKILESGSEAMLITSNFMCSYVSEAVEGETLRGIAAQAARVQNEGILKRYAECACSIAQELNVPIADTFGKWEQLRDAGVDTTVLLSNGINHPTAEMHELFVEEILKTAFAADKK